MSSIEFTIGFEGWGQMFPFPEYKRFHPNQEEAETEVNRVLNLLPQFRIDNEAYEKLIQEHMGMSFPPRPDRAYIIPSPFKFPRLTNPPSLKVIEGPAV